MRRILVTGGTGLIGSALKDIMPENIYLGSREYDLTKQYAVCNMLELYKPDIVIHLAALVSGIQENILKPCDHFVDNVLMNTFILDTARRYGIRRCISVLSTCAYADVSESYPIKESQIYEGLPTVTNFSYGFAKRMVAVQTEACNKQYGTNYSYILPCNVYGLNDKYNEKRSHFLGALIRKIYEAKINNSETITLFGTGKPLRQFIFAGDVAKIIKHLIYNDITENINIANDEICSIDELAQIALKACDMEHLKIVYDSSKPDGQYRKDASNEKLKSIMPDIKFTSLFDGIKKTFEHYQNLKR